MSSGHPRLRRGGEPEDERIAKILSESGIGVGHIVIDSANDGSKPRQISPNADGREEKSAADKSSYPPHHQKQEHDKSEAYLLQDIGARTDHLPARKSEKKAREAKKESQIVEEKNIGEVFCEAEEWDAPAVKACIASDPQPSNTRSKQPSTAASLLSRKVEWGTMKKNTDDCAEMIGKADNGSGMVKETSSFAPSALSGERSWSHRKYQTRGCAQLTEEKSTAKNEETPQGFGTLCPFSQQNQSSIQMKREEGSTCHCCLHAEQYFPRDTPYNVKSGKSCPQPEMVAPVSRQTTTWSSPYPNPSINHSYLNEGYLPWVLPDTNWDIVGNGATSNVIETNNNNRDNPNNRQEQTMTNLTRPGAIAVPGIEAPNSSEEMRTEPSSEPHSDSIGLYEAIRGQPRVFSARVLIENTEGGDTSMPTRREQINCLQRTEETDVDFREPAYNGVVMPSQTQTNQQSSNAKCARIKKFTHFMLFLLLVICAVIVAGALLPLTAFHNLDAASSRALSDVVKELSDPEALRDPDSPQSSALRWLSAQEERENASSPASINALKQRYALAVLYFSTGGQAHWTNQFSFLSTAPECEWQDEDGHGVKCNNLTVVSEINLPKNNITGTIPGSELKAFPSLSRINFSHNNLQGTVPEELAELTYLRNVSLEKNNLTGPLMENIGDLKYLANFNMFGNNLDSHIPSSLTKLHLLQHLDLRQNKLTGTIPSNIGAMSSLAYLLLSFNRLSSTLPLSWNRLDDLREIRIAGNALNGTLSICPACNSNLEMIVAGRNLFSGTLPSLLGFLPKLRLLFLPENQFIGTIPPSLTSGTVLQVIYLDYNFLTGTIPPDLFASETLEGVSIGHNDITGTLPPFLGDQSKIWGVSAENNMLTGTIPSTYGSLPAMLGLSLRSNLLTGTIPSSLGENSAMIGLMVENNMLSGVIPNTFSKLSAQIQWLSLARNDLEGSIDHICAVETNKKRILTADCAQPNAEVLCYCCAFCCNDADSACNHHLPIKAFLDDCVTDGSCVIQGFFP